MKDIPKSRSATLLRWGAISATIIGLALLQAVLGRAAAAQEESAPPVIVDLSGPPAKTPLSPADPDAVPGLRVESNGAAIIGPIGEREVYIPLDRAVIGRRLRGTWAQSPAQCERAAAPDGEGAGRPPNGVMVVHERDITTATGVLALQYAYAPLPSSYTMTTLQSGRPLRLRASDYRDTHDMLLVLSEARDSSRMYLRLRLSDDGKSLVVSSRNGPETGYRCDR